MKASKEAKVLVSKGFVGNGCGSGWASKIACYALEQFFDTNLSEAWLYHDAEYSLSRSIKSAERRELADADLHDNINTLMGIEPEDGSNPFRARLGKIVHAALVLKGDRAYWDTEKPKVTTLFTNVAVAGVILFEIYKRI